MTGEQRPTVRSLAAEVAALRAELAALRRPSRQVTRSDAQRLDAGCAGWVAHTPGVRTSAGMAMNLIGWLRDLDDEGTPVPEWLEIDDLAAAADAAMLGCSFERNGWI
ncbi:MAG: hypothetical protein QM733_18925 [Ilumatobacteraceae bacterium]